MLRYFDGCPERLSAYMAYNSGGSFVVRVMITGTRNIIEESKRRYRENRRWVGGLGLDVEGAVWWAQAHPTGSVTHLDEQRCITGKRIKHCDKIDQGGMFRR
jgi:hypothetical protein